MKRGLKWHLTCVEDPWSCHTNWQVDGSSVLMATAVLQVPCELMWRWCTDGLFWRCWATTKLGNLWRAACLTRKTNSIEVLGKPMCLLFSNLTYWNHFARKIGHQRHSEYCIVFKCCACKPCKILQVKTPVFEIRTNWLVLAWRQLQTIR